MGERNNKTLRYGISVVSSRKAKVTEKKFQKSRQTEDELTRNMLASTASTINATGGTNGDNPTEITRSDVDTIIRTLADNNAYTINIAVVSKPSLIDLEAPEQGDRGEPIWDVERLNEKAA